LYREKSAEESKLIQCFEALSVLRKEFDALHRPDVAIENKAMQQGRAMFEKARAQVIETGDKLRSSKTKSDPSKDPVAEGAPIDEKASPPSMEVPTESLPSEETENVGEEDEDVGGDIDVAHGETEGWEFDELEEEAHQAAIELKER
jgi:hypothetical protein